MLTNSASTVLLEDFSSLFLDLDGVVYRSGVAVEKAIETLTIAKARGATLRFLTNNASRTRVQVADNLNALGLVVEPNSVVTSAMATADVMSRQLAPGAIVYFVGHEGLKLALESVGLVPTRDASLDVAAVVQGHSPDTNWQDLAFAGHLISSGIPWYATNTDATFPTSTGIAPGNGAFVRLLQDLTNKSPLVAGKPYEPLFTTALASVQTPPLMVGDRLDTDIEGAVREGIASAWVSTGVHQIKDVINAGPTYRPNFLLADLAGLLRPQPPVSVEGLSAICGQALALANGTHIRLARDGSTREEEYRAVAGLAWHLRDVVGIRGDLSATLDT